MDIIRKYAPRLAGWVSEQDSGQADAVNKGFARASGEYVAWLNSDDLYYPGALREAARALEANPSASFVFSDVESIDGTGKAFNRMRYGAWGLADLMRFRIIGQPECLCRSALLEAGFGYQLYYILTTTLAEAGGFALFITSLAPVGNRYAPDENTAQGRFAPEGRAWRIGRHGPALSAPGRGWKQIRAGPAFGAFYLMKPANPAFASYAALGLSG